VLEQLCFVPGGLLVAAVVRLGLKLLLVVVIRPAAFRAHAVLVKRLDAVREARAIVVRHVALNAALERAMCRSTRRNARLCATGGGERHNQKRATYARSL